MAGTFASNAEILRKAGANANSTATGSTYTDQYAEEVESRINAESEYNWTDNYASLNTDVKYILREASSNMAAIYVINYDPEAWTPEVATFKINVLYTAYQDCIKLLREKDKAQIFIQEA